MLRVPLASSEKLLLKTKRKDALNLECLRTSGREAELVRELDFLSLQRAVAAGAPLKHCCGMKKTTTEGNGQLRNRSALIIFTSESSSLQTNICEYRYSYSFQQRGRKLFSKEI